MREQDVTEKYQIYAGPGSPYSHKVRAVFRYRRIPHTWCVPIGGFSGEGSLGSDANKADSPLARAAKGVVPVVEYPDGSFWADSTPIIDQLEKRHEGRSVVHPEAAVEFLARLIEDLADEYLPIPMFYSRWTTDKNWCGKRQMVGWSEPINDEELQRRASSFLERQGSQLGNLDVDQMKTASEAFYHAMENLLSRQHFLFGARPSIADFALFGQLTQYAVDPTLCERMKETAIRTYQWTHLVDDLSGWEGEWLSLADISTEALGPFLELVRDYYLPMGEFVLAISEGQDLTDALNGPGYRAKAFLEVKARFAGLTAEAKSVLEGLLRQHGCWDGLQMSDDEAERVVPIVTQ
jgi:glutathione S-transferase